MPKRVIYLIASDSMPGLVKLGLAGAGTDDKKTAIDDQVLPAGFQCVFAGIISCHSRVLGVLMNALAGIGLKDISFFMESPSDRPWHCCHYWLTRRYVPLS